MTTSQSNNIAIKRQSIISSLMEAGFHRAEMVYDSYLESREEWFNDHEIDDINERFLSDGQPNPDYMIRNDWPDNLNQVILDEEFEIDIKVFPDYKGYCKMGYTMDFIAPYIRYDEVVKAIEDGANKFIKSKYKRYNADRLSRE